MKLFKGVLVFVALISASVTFAEAASQFESLKNGAFIINEDNSHFFGTRSADDMTLDGLHAFVDQYADSAVTHLFLCPNAMRASFRSKTREAIWDVTGKETYPTGKRANWPNNARLLHERGLDPYKVWIDRCREKGISPWLSMRMNDLHSVPDNKNFMHSSFWRDNPQFWRVPNVKKGGWPNWALNYRHPAVREHNMAFVRELLERYDPDGLELDWMRFGYHLTPGKESKEARIITDFMRQVRQLTKGWSVKRGHPVLLSARVPSHPDAAAGLGMDGVEWAKEGLVDMLVPCPFWTTSDFDIPVDLWKERIGADGAKVVIAPGLEHNSRSWPAGKAAANNLPAVYGFAASTVARGADATYLFNFMDSGTRPVSASDYGTLVKYGVESSYIAKQVRRCPVTFRDTVPQDFPRGICLPIKSGLSGSMRIYLAPAESGDKAFVVLGLSKPLEPTSWDVKLNGDALSKPVALKDITGIGGGAVAAVRFPVEPALLKIGYNDVTLKLDDKNKDQKVVWCEIRLVPGS